MWKCPKCGREFKRQDQGHYCVKPETIDQYIEFQDESVRPYLRAVRETIRLPYQDPLPLEVIADIAKWCREKYSA